MHLIEYRSSRSSSNCFSLYPSQCLRKSHLNANISQAFKKGRLARDGLLDISKLIEAFLRRLEIYSEVSLNQELMDTIMAIMVEILCILAIVTKEMKLEQLRKSLLYRTITDDRNVFSKTHK